MDRSTKGEVRGEGGRKCPTLRRPKLRLIRRRASQVRQSNVSPDASPWSRRAHRLLFLVSETARMDENAHP